MNKTKMPDLAEDLILEIQLRLPVKSVIRFKSVSKSWLARFQNPDFIESHFAKQKYLDGDNFDRSVVLPFGLGLFYDPTFKFLTKMEESNSTLTAKEKIRFPFLSSRNAPRNANWCIKSQCMGIILLSHGEKVALWNPTTREFKLLPQLPRPKFYWLLVAIGYDHKTSDFKLLRYVYKNKGGKTLGTMEIVGVIEIYSLNHNKWRELPVERKNNFGNVSSSSIFINGVCHWVEYDDIFNKTLIMSFDMTNETIKTTNLGVDDYSNFQLFSVGGSLTAVQFYDFKRYFINIWKLNNLDDPASWTKQKLGTEYYCLGFWKNSQIFSMRVHDNDLLLHDLNTGKNRILKEKFCPFKTKQNGREMLHWEMLGCLVYVESLYQIKRVRPNKISGTGRC